MKVAAIVQARSYSNRLPEKVLEEIEEKPMLLHIIERIKRSELTQEIIIATTTQKKDELIVQLAEESKTKWFRGRQDDVLDRYYQAAKEFDVSVIVRITGDCPLIDPEIVDRVINFFLKNRFDFVSNIHPPTYPDGLDVEVFSFATLRKMWKEAKKASEREHVTPYILNHPEMFRIGNVKNERDLSCMRWVVDEQRDLEFAKVIYRRLYRDNEIFCMSDVLNLLQEEPQLSRINKGISRNEGYMKSLREDKVLNLNCLEK